MLSFSCAAQSVPPNAKEILTSKDWKIDGYGVENIYKIKFTNTAIIVHHNNELIGELEYYFSTTLNDCSPNGFNENNVGDTLSGKYLISEKSCLELINVSENELKFKSVYGGNPNNITTASPI
ncbi:hypothetical protein [Nonlabens agnitus]|uniref:Lipocalin-like domain-containing protein n=1 Tax=Nonlabens agnitus TaxID=870484 RepID=A0A2S9WWQ8_9FLAO|nr:hypothetical protein [Nonlabens agnitus]PRP67816.1 hypothetical protein BST86_12290 [Nonlabens agnitus]